jgi:hypothetical protein
MLFSFHTVLVFTHLRCSYNFEIVSLKEQSNLIRFFNGERKGGDKGMKGTKGRKKGEG